MNYRLIRNARGKNRFTDIGLPLFLVGAIVLFHALYPGLLGGFASRVAEAFWGAGRLVSEQTHRVFFFFSSKQTLSRDIERLSRELTRARELLLDRDLIAEENRMLREQLGRTDGAKARLIGAVLVTPPRSLYDSVVIDVGASNGVTVGDLALSGNTVLGAVSAVYERTSRVEFFSTAGKKTALIILHAGNAVPIEGAGRGGGEWSATLPKEVGVAVGDPVVMPGLTPRYFAAVNVIESSAADSFQIVRFTNPVPLGALRFLEIEKRESEAPTL